MAITMAKLKSGLQSTLLRNPQSLNTIKRSFSSAHHDVATEAKEAVKWEKLTYLGIASCTALAVWNMSKGHPHFDEVPAYSHMHIRNKEFPWGPDGLFEVKEHH